MAKNTLATREYFFYCSASMRSNVGRYIFTGKLTAYLRKRVKEIQKKQNNNNY